MTIRHGTIRIGWVLTVAGAETDPDNLLDVSRQAIAAAISDGENDGVVIEQVLYDDDDGVPAEVTPIETGCDP